MNLLILVRRLSKQNNRDENKVFNETYKFIFQKRKEDYYEEK